MNGGKKILPLAGPEGSARMPRAVGQPTALPRRLVPPRAIAMHVISRRETESIVIDNRITVTIKEINESSVLIAIESPDEDPSYREEVLYLVPQYA